MRQITISHYFTFVYPGRAPGGEIDNNAPHIAIPKDGEWVSICGSKYGGEQSSAVFYHPQDLRDLADALYEVASLFEEKQAARKAK